MAIVRQPHLPLLISEEVGNHAKGAHQPDNLNDLIPQLLAAVLGLQPASVESR